MEKAIKRYWPVFLLPTAAAFIIGFAWPFLQGLYLSFTKFTTVDNATWTGLSNYKYALTDSSFYSSFLFTALFTIVSIILINGIAFMLALALSRAIKGTNIFRTIFFLPNLIGGIVLGYTWKIILDSVITKLYNSLLALNSTYGFWGLVILMCWQQIGYMMIIYIAGLQSIPKDYIEAAEIDGANSWQILWRIKIPNLMPSITICTFLTLTNGFKLFDQNLALTNGDPGGASEMVALNIYKTFYGRTGPQWKGYGQAKAVIFCIFVIIISLIQLRATSSREVQE